MTEFIGSRISLISKRDIRYVGTLHQISSEDATVALENVRSFGTEGRRPGEEVGPSDTVYEYIVFKGSDVKDLRIEEGPKEPETKPTMPDDPAILGSTRKPTPGSNAPQPTQSADPQHPQNEQLGPPQQPFGPPGHNQRPPFPQMPYPPYGFPPPNQRFGPQGFSSGPPGGFPNMPYGAPPQWYGHGGFGPPPPHMQHAQFLHQPMPIGPPGQQRGPNQPPKPPAGAPTGPAAGRDMKKPLSQPDQSQPPAPTNADAPAPPAAPNARGPEPPTETKPNVNAALAPPAPAQDQLDGQALSTAAKPGKIVPAIPLASPATKPATTANGQAKTAALAAQGAAMGTAQALAAKLTVGEKAGQPLATAGAVNDKKTIEQANRDARAAVAEAMAKLSAGKKPGEANAAVDNLTKQVAAMRTNANGVPSGGRKGSTSSQPRRGRGGRQHQETRKVEVPTEDFDFESANAKFNKQDLVKEAIATGSPLQSPTDGDGPSELSAVPADTHYNKASSFFDNISSEIKERADGGAGEQLGGREFRNEERRKNMETFGQGSVDSGYRYSGRGRGRGRGRSRGGYRGRGGAGARNGGIVSAEG